MLLTVLGWVFTGLLLVLFGACVGAGRGRDFHGTTFR